MDKKMKRELDNTFSMVDKVAKAFHDLDKAREEHIARREYYCWICKCMQSLDNPCRHGGPK